MLKFRLQTALGMLLQLNGPPDAHRAAIEGVKMFERGEACDHKRVTVALRISILSIILSDIIRCNQMSV